MSRSAFEQFIADNPQSWQQALSTLTPEQAEELRYDWSWNGRPEQQEPSEPYSIWFIQAGRGWGKSRTFNEQVRRECERNANILISGPTADDIRNTLIETGPSSIMRIFPPHQRPQYEPSKRRLTFHTGCIAQLIPMSEPERFRGPGLGWAGFDEIAGVRPAVAKAAWDNFVFSLREGEMPRVMVTSTPKPTAIMRQILATPGCYVTRGSSYDNRSNLSPKWYAEHIAPYEGTRFGRQEIEGELLLDVPGALWTVEMIENHRIRTDQGDAQPRYGKTCVAIDPAASSNETSDDTGIFVGSLDRDDPTIGYARADRTVSQAKPRVWAQAAIDAFREFDADFFVAEVNNGGEMVENTIHQLWPGAPIKTVHASQSKAARAEPVSVISEKGRIRHVGDPKALAKLENELTNWDPKTSGWSPNRLDAYVWCWTELFVLRPNNGLVDLLKEQAQQLTKDRDAGTLLVPGMERCPQCASSVVQIISSVDRKCGNCGTQWKLISPGEATKSFQKTSQGFTWPGRS